VREVVRRKLELHVVHRVEHVAQAGDEVLEDELAEVLDLAGREGVVVDEAHLLEHGRLARVARAEEEDFDLAVERRFRLAGEGIREIGGGERAMRGGGGGGSGAGEDSRL
jgi:hypothetical protein